MGRWDARLDRLEDRIGGRGCLSCGAGGGGPMTIRMHQEGDPEPRVCEVCGAEPYRFSLTLDNPNDAGTSNND